MEEDHNWTRDDESCRSCPCEVYDPPLPSSRRPSDMESFIRELVEGVARDEGEGGFPLWADIDGYEWLARVEKALKEGD